MKTFVTTGCAALDHPEFTLIFRNEPPVPGLEKTLLGYFEASVAAGKIFKVGETVQLGWATLRLMQRSDGTLGVLEPDIAHELKWVEGVDQSLFETWRQKEVLSSLGLFDRADFPRQALHAVVCTQAFDTDTRMLGRTEAHGQTDSGWFVGCFDGAHDHQHEDALTVKPLVEIATLAPSLTQFFALPPGTDLLVGPDGIEVFIDGEARKPQAGSYLDALSQHRSHST
ncbi:MAG: immunity protein Imm33 domain-containing protein [Archangium sp.]